MASSFEDLLRWARSPSIEPAVYTQKQLAAARKLQEEWEEEQRIQDEKKEIDAQENGFPSYAEYEEHVMAAWQDRQDAYIKALEEDCARRGITLEQHFAQDPQCQETPIHVMPACDCQGSYPIIKCAARFVESTQNTSHHSSAPVLLPTTAPKTHLSGWDTSQTANNFDLRKCVFGSASHPDDYQTNRSNGNGLDHLPIPRRSQSFPSGPVAIRSSSASQVRPPFAPSTRQALRPRLELPHHLFNSHGSHGHGGAAHQTNEQSEK